MLENTKSVEGSKSALNDGLSFDLKDNYDISFCSKIQKLLIASGFNTSSISSDEDGHEHCIKFSIGNCEGEIHSCCGKIVHIETF